MHVQSGLQTQSFCGQLNVLKWVAALHGDIHLHAVSRQVAKANLSMGD